MDRISIYEEFRLIERNEAEVNGAWKGAHLLLFFLAFVFGSFCTFCFHMLMYLFDEKCVLFPKLMSLSSFRQNVIYEFIPPEKEIADMLPVDFVSTQWVDKSACYLPTYVPLVSGIFGLVWTTMFLMCSTGSRTLTGLQRPWRVLLPVFVFSIAMGGLCVYSSTVTHYGLQELCVKLGEITGSSTCTYTINVATLAYERQIRGVYQATRLTIISAWLHTACWLLSAILTVARVLMAVDFQLVRINVALQGDIDKILERQERQIRTVSPDVWADKKESSGSVRVHKKPRIPPEKRPPTPPQQTSEPVASTSHSAKIDYTPEDVLYYAGMPVMVSEMSLVPEEQQKLSRITAYNSVPKDKVFIVKWLYDLVDTMDLPDQASESSPSSDESLESPSSGTGLSRQYGQQVISSKARNVNGPGRSREYISIDLEEAEQVATEIKKHLENRLNATLNDLPRESSIRPERKAYEASYESILNITPEMVKALGTRERRLTHPEIEEPVANIQPSTAKKSNLKHKGVQTENTKDKKSMSQKVQISESTNSVFNVEPSSSEATSSGVEKETQTDKPKKEKQD